MQVALKMLSHAQKAVMPVHYPKKRKTSIPEISLEGLERETSP